MEVWKGIMSMLQEKKTTYSANMNGDHSSDQELTSKQQKAVRNKKGLRKVEHFTTTSDVSDSYDLASNVFIPSIPLRTILCFPSKWKTQGRKRSYKSFLAK